MTYEDRVKQVVLDSYVCCYVLMGEPNDVRFIQIYPKRATDQELLDLRAHFIGTGLRGIGVIGLVRDTPKYAFKELLTPDQTTAMCVSFLAYLNVLFAGNFYATQEATEVAELRRIYAYADPSAPQV